VTSGCLASCLTAQAKSLKLPPNLLQLLNFCACAMGPKRAPNAKPRRTKEAATLSKQLQAAHAGVSFQPFQLLVYPILTMATAARRDLRD